jgi:hypothetical protein
LQEVDVLMGQDAGVDASLLGIRSFFVTTDELFCSPGNVVRKIAGLGNEGGLERALELSAPYSRDHAKAIAGLVEHFKRVVFPEA